MNSPYSNRFEQMLDRGDARPQFFQGVCPFLGAGLLTAHRLSPEFVYTVPAGCTAALMYFRAGNASDQLIYLSIVGNGTPRRYFAIGPQGASHVELVIKDNIPAGVRLELHIAAAAGVHGTAVVDIGFLEWNTETA